MKMINADQISTNMNGDTLEIFIDNKLTAEITDGNQQLGFVYDVLHGMGYEVNEDNFVQRAFTDNEHLFSFRQNQQTMMQTGFIGYLRADFGSTGKEFYSTWNEFNKSLKTQEFSLDLDCIINQFRDKDCLLESRNAMSTFCHLHKDWKIPCDREYYGIRVDTTKYSYMLRFTPQAGDYNLYCYCYKKDYFDQFQERAKKGIRFIDTSYKEKFTIPDGDRVRIQMPYGKHTDYVCRYVDEYHLYVGDHLYHICQFAEMLEQNGYTVIPMRNSLPEQCFSTLPSTGELILITKGESNYAPCYDYSTSDRAENREFANDRNIKNGVTKAQEEAMLAGSMFGWHTPAADPKNYDENGHPIKPKGKNKDYER